MNKTKYLYAILPHRGIAAGKSRLATVLDDGARCALNRWLLERTLQLVSAWLGDAKRCVVVSPCADTLALARTAGAVALREQAPPQGLNAALAQGAAHAATLGAHRLLILPCDLPRLELAALQSMAALADTGCAAVIAPDRHNAGTNALLVDASVREFAFGANSFVRHVALAEARGTHALTCANPALAFDLDSAGDFAQWMRSGDERPDFLTAWVPVPAA